MELTIQLLSLLQLLQIEVRQLYRISLVKDEMNPFGKC
jgi:hypothetical protein